MNWPQFAYQTLIGGAFFLLTLWAGTRQTPRPPSDRIALRVIVGGMALYILADAAWIALAGA